MLEPPVFADVAPKITRKIIVKPYNQYSIPLIVAKWTTKSGNTPPTVKDAPDAKAACIGFACRPKIGANDLKICELADLKLQPVDLQQR
jgi:hypothetical protein